MRIGIISDTHDRAARTAAAVRLLAAEGAEALIHCGDLTGPDVVYECAALPASFVFGNNDFDTAALRRAMADTGAACLGRGGMIELAGRRLAVTHGDSPREVARLLALGPDYLFSGHSHAPADERFGPTRRVNPGALHRAAIKTVALVDLASETVKLLSVDSRFG